MRDEALSVGVWNEPQPSSYLLFDDLASGFAVLNTEGHILYANVSAQLLLDGSMRQRFRDALGQLVQRIQSSAGVSEICVPSGSHGNVRLSAVQSPTVGEVWIVLERDGLEQARTEVALLRELLATATSTEGTEEACRRLLSSMTQRWPGTHWALYRADAAGQLVLSAFAQNPLQPDAFQVDADTSDNKSAVATAFHRRRMLHFREAARAPLFVPCSSEYAHETSVWVMPIRVAEETLGVLYVGGPSESFALPQLRLIQGLADGLGSLLRHSRLREEGQKAANEASQARQMAAQKERLARLGQRVAGVAHEVNNPLAYVQGNLGALRQSLVDLQKTLPQDDASPVLQEALAMTDDALLGLTRISRLVSAVKSTARHAPAEKIRFRPNQAIDDAVLVFQGARKGVCHLQIDVPPLPQVWGSPTELTQVFLNLLENGLEAMGGQGKLHVSARRISADEIEMSVRDEGGGIPEDVQPRVFEAFFTTRAETGGTGLGLYLSQRIVESHQGTLSFVTSPEGTTFTVRLPAIRSP